MFNLKNLSVLFFILFCGSAYASSINNGQGLTGTVTSSTAGQTAYFQSTGTTVIGTSTLTVSGGQVGIGTATPLSAVTVNGVSSYTGTAPACGTGCASITAGSTNARGSFVTGTSITSSTLTFASSGVGVWGTSPFCTISDSNTSAVSDISALSTVSLTVSLASALSSVTIYYICQQ